MANDKPKPQPRPQRPPEKKTVWVSCRAKAGCEGKQAIIVFSNKTPGGGHVTRYRCTKCGGAFHVQV